uniref:Uncharacterized protein n=1 Tax=Scleropages formosus TaxID=113540 RepID=A0A8C9S5S9_SCLFO
MFSCTVVEFCLGQLIGLVLLCVYTYSVHELWFFDFLLCFPTTSMAPRSCPVCRLTDPLPVPGFEDLPLLSTSDEQRFTWVQPSRLPVFHVTLCRTEGPVQLQAWGKVSFLLVTLTSTLSTVLTLFGGTQVPFRLAVVLLEQLTLNLVVSIPLFFFFSLL